MKQQQAVAAPRSGRDEDALGTAQRRPQDGLVLEVVGVADLQIGRHPEQFLEGYAVPRRASGGPRQKWMR